jgi:hypothetical protein
LHHCPLPEIPPLNAINPMTLSLTELQKLHEQLGEWLNAAMAAPDSDAPDDSRIEAVRSLLVQITRERRERQADERRAR